MKTFIMKNNFSAGELAPTLYTRTDIQQYGNGAKILLNVIPLVEGGVKKRPGTLYVFTLSGAKRLIPFVVNSDKAYLLVLKSYALDVFDPKTMKIIASLITPYSDAYIHDVQFVQYRHEMYMTHNAVPVQRFSCSTIFDNWKIEPFIYTHAPTDSETSRYPFRKGKPSGKDLGVSISFILDPVNEWLPEVGYLKSDVIRYQNNIYQALSDNTNQTPSLNLNIWSMILSTASGFSSVDVGKYIEVNEGIIKITEFISEKQVNGEIIKKLTSDIKAIERSWSVLSPAFNSDYGYPKCCTFFKQRLVLANTIKAPNKIWFSAVGGNGNFLETTEDGDAFSIVSASGLSNSILFLEAQRGVVCLTSGGEYMVDSDGGLTPTTVNINEHSAFGAYPITRPERVGNELLFVQRGGERLRAMTYRYEVDGLVSPEISSLSSHIGEIHGGINEISYMQEPENLVWVVLGDGKVASITFNRDQEVIAWAQHDFGGKVLSICSVPTQLGSDRAFMLVERSGLVCLEEISFSAYMDSQRTEKVVSNAIYIPPLLDDVCLSYSDADSIYEVSYKVFESALRVDSSLEGLNVQVGRIIKSSVELFPPELSQAPVSSMLHKAKVDRTGFFFNKTIAPELNGEMIELFTFNDNLMEPPKPKTGYYIHEGGSWDDLHQIPLVVTHNKPLPFHLQSITMQLSINEK